MTRLAPALTRTKHPLRYWMTVVYAVGLPNFVKFDSSNLTHNAGLFNLTSIGAMLLSFSVAFLLLGMHLLNRQPLLLRPLRCDAPLWMALLCIMSVTTLLGPGNRLAPGSHTDFLVSVYRMFEWVVAFVLLQSLYTREPQASARDLVVRLLGTVCWTNILLVWCMLPIMPSYVYAESGDTAEATHRLGGSLIHPIGLGLYAEIGFFYALLFTSGWRRYAGSALAVLTLFLTYARAEEGAFVLTFFLYMLFLSRRAAWKAAGAAILLLVVLGGALFSERILDYAGRGHGLSNVVTLSERTYVWEAAERAFVKRPWIGYGYINGPKNALREEWRFAHWIPPHCHNELLQSLVSGGIGAGALVLLLYLRTLWRAARKARASTQHAFLFLVFLQLTILSFGESVLTNPISRSGALLLIAFMGIAGGAHRKAAPRFQPLLHTPLPEPASA